MSDQSQSLGASNAAIETLQNALGYVKLLRCSMTHTIESIKEHTENYHNIEGVSSEERERNFRMELHANIQRVHTNYREVERLVSSLNAPHIPLMLGNTGIINQEVSEENIPLYSQLIDSYKWIEKVHEYAGLAFTLIGQNPLKRTYFGAGLSAKRRKNLANNYVVLNNSVIDSAITNINNSYKDMEIKIVRPLGSNSILCITLGRTLRSIVILKGWLIEWVIIRGVFEEMNLESGELDLWSESKYKIFQKITDNANAAFLHFNVPTHPELSVRSFIIWLHSYIDLFSKPCKKCSLHLVNNHPPSWRDLRLLEPYHEECKP